MGTFFPDCRIKRTLPGFSPKDSVYTFGDAVLASKLKGASLKRGNVLFTVLNITGYKVGHRSLSVVLHSAATAGFISDVKEVWKHMRHHKMLATENYNSLMELCLKLKQSNSVRRVYHNMKLQGVPPDAATFAYQLRALGQLSTSHLLDEDQEKADRIYEEASNLLKEGEKKGIPADREMLTRLLRCTSRSEQVVKIMSKLDKQQVMDKIFFSTALTKLIHFNDSMVLYATADEMNKRMLFDKTAMNTIVKFYEANFDLVALGHTLKGAWTRFSLDLLHLTTILKVVTPYAAFGNTACKRLGDLVIEIGDRKALSSIDGEYQIAAASYFAATGQQHRLKGTPQKFFVKLEAQGKGWGCKLAKLARQHKRVSPL
eukprot:TRINITY_DN20724_c0_g1_i1.p1 TRINITY_DN20724_c0_g1~~TRINITY_DN20724_c0_g1_i1.p1  ORF type:complete len:373 (+),score=67.11 TRINITY_DN20724_c0_g1_i1:38-1156(+)